MQSFGYYKNIMYLCIVIIKNIVLTIKTREKWENKKLR